MMGWDDALGFGLKIIDKLIPDPAAKAQAQLELLKLQQNGELAQLNADLELAKAQAATNTAEASNPNVFVSGWRPFIGWTCGAGLAVQFIAGPLCTWLAALFERTAAFPTLDTGTLLTLLFGMLGLGGMRTAEKFKGVASK